MNKGIGLVLTGGRGKGTYFIGVWKALREYGIDDRVTSCFDFIFYTEVFKSS